MLQTLSIKPLPDVYFQEEFPGDTNNRMILNEAAIRKMGFSSPQEAVGGKVKFDWRGESYSWTIIGVVKDFHFEDLHVPIEPYGFQLNNRTEFQLYYRHAKARDIASVVKSVGASWHN